MEEREETITDEKWQAVIGNDASYDGRFFYAVKTTGIFCRPSCKSKPPRQENIRMFRTADQALSEGFRPCKRCKPTGVRLPDEEWLATVTEYIDAHYQDRLSLDVLADVCHGSPYHLHRTFKRIKGITPIEYIQRKRIDHAIRLLTVSDRPVTEIGQDVGMPNLPYFTTLFKKRTGMTPARYRQSMRFDKEVLLNDTPR